MTKTFSAQCRVQLDRRRALSPQQLLPGRPERFGCSPASPSRWCKGTCRGESRHIGSVFGDVLRSPGDSRAAATLQLVALLRHPDGVDELAGGEIEQISIGAVAECGVGGPVYVRRMRLTGRDSG